MRCPEEGDEVALCVGGDNAMRKGKRTKRRRRAALARVGVLPWLEARVGKGEEQVEEEGELPLWRSKERGKSRGVSF